MESVDIAFDPFTLYEATDPYPTYRSLRNEAPVHYLEEAELWVITRYEHCTEVLRDPATYSSKLGMRAALSGTRRGRHGGSDPSENPFGMTSSEDLRILIAIDPPEHVRLRRLLSRPFTPRLIGLHEEWMRPLCQQCFADILCANAQGHADWVRNFSWPFPVLVIGELMGIPASMRDDFKRWSDDLIGIFVGGPDLSAQPRDSMLEMVAFFAETIDRCRSEPGDNLVSMLIARAEADEELLTADELVMFCVLLLVAGNETTTNLLSNLMKVLAKDPAMLGTLRDAPELIPGVVEEALRYESPIQAIPRGTTRSTQLGGTQLPEEAILLAYVGAANRDERHYENPDRFDIKRNPTDHLGFGSGIHLCLGAPLARLEACIALETQTNDVVSVEMSAHPVPTGGLLLRGAASMPIHVELG